jgi:phospholipid/cholesterol/gamma-HCH transport system substrate-binding protein
MNSRKLEILVGFFVALGILAFAMLALKVANSGIAGTGETYSLSAKFENIGSLKERAPVKVGGVVIGRAESIYVDPQEFLPVVNMTIDAQYLCRFSDTSSISILTSGILGEQYLGINPVIAPSSAEKRCLGEDVENTKQDAAIDDLFGVESKALGDGDVITDTKSAIVLEELIGQFLFNQGSE